MTVFTADLKKRKNKVLVRSSYLNPPKDFDTTMALAKDYMLVNEAMDSLEDEERVHFSKQHKKTKWDESSSKQPAAQKSSPLPPRH